MFEWLEQYNKVLVTGPQRSGTRICAKMIAHDLDYDLIDETDLEMDSLYLLCSYLENRNRLVVQCPTLCRYIHILSGDDTAVILMRRSVKDIIASQQRIHWRWEWLELARYDRTDGVISDVKYEFWEKNQKDKIKHSFEIEYQSLAGHPLWISGALRGDFAPQQTKSAEQGAMIDACARLIPNANVLSWVPSGDSEGLLAKTSELAKLLNASGRFVWALCDGEHSRQDILEAMKAEFEDVSEDVLARDLDDFVADLLAHGFLRVNE